MLPLYPIGEPGFRVAYDRCPMRIRHFVKYTFLKVDPAWRRLDSELALEHKREFTAACEDFADGHLLRSFSLVGTRGDADLMLLSQAQNLERIHEFHVVLQQSGLMKWCATPYSFLAMTKESEYSDESRLEVRPAHGKYLFVYPFVKTRDWYLLDAKERWRIMQEHIKVGRGVPVDRPQHELLVRARRSGVRGRVRVRRPGRLPRPRAEAAHDRVERVHEARHADLHLHLLLAGARPRRRSTARRWRSPRNRPAAASAESHRPLISGEFASSRRRRCGDGSPRRSRGPSGLSGGWLRVRYVEVTTSFATSAHFHPRPLIAGPGPRSREQSNPENAHPTGPRPCHA